MHCCGTSRREGSNVSNPERKRTKSLASKQLTVDVPKNLPPLWSGKFGKQKLCRYLQSCYIVCKMVGMGIWFIAATPWHRHKRDKVWFGQTKMPYSRKTIARLNESECLSALLAHDSLVATVERLSSPEKKTHSTPKVSQGMNLWINHDHQRPSQGKPPQY